MMCHFYNHIYNPKGPDVFEERLAINLSMKNVKGTAAEEALASDSCFNVSATIFIGKNRYICEN